MCSEHQFYFCFLHVGCLQTSPSDEEVFFWVPFAYNLKLTSSEIQKGKITSLTKFFGVEIVLKEDGQQFPDLAKM